MIEDFKEGALLALHVALVGGVLGFGFLLNSIIEYQARLIGAPEWIIGLGSFGLGVIIAFIMALIWVTLRGVSEHGPN